MVAHNTTNITNESLPEQTTEEIEGDIADIHRLEPNADSGDFAYMKSYSHDAQVEFSKVVTYIRSKGKFANHFQKFIFSREAHLFADFDDEDDEIRWKGYYQFNMKINPRSLKSGWVLGCLSPEESTDILLCVEPVQGVKVRPRSGLLPGRCLSDGRFSPKVILIDYDRQIMRA